MVEGARLESVYTPKAYRGFESLPLCNPMPQPGHFLLNKSVAASKQASETENEPCDEGAGFGLVPPPGSRAQRVLPSSLQPTLFLPLFPPKSSEFGVFYDISGLKSTHIR